MNRPSVSELPAKFVENTIALCGDRGRKWLEGLPETICRLEERWDIKAGKYFRNLSYNYVANAVLSGGESAVLKIAPPLEDTEIAGEAGYLRILDGRGTVKLFQFDPEYKSVLLERVAPGKSLRSVCKNDKARAVAIAISVLKGVLRPVPETVSSFIKLDDWFDGLKRASGTNFPQDYAEKAMEFYGELSRDETNIRLLHGDLHHDNILSATREPFLMIDPKGIIGHVGYDIGVFLNNHHDWLDWDTKLEGTLDSAVAEFASAFDLTELTIRKWAFCQMVLSWWWMFDEMPEKFGDELGLSDIWKV